jgi:hypothetical protein
VTSPSSSSARFRECFDRASILGTTRRKYRSVRQRTSLDRARPQQGRRGKRNVLQVKLPNDVVDRLFAWLLCSVLERVGVPVKIVGRHGLHSGESFVPVGGGGGGGGEGAWREIQGELFLTVVGLEVGFESGSEFGVGGVGRVLSV